jgi:phospholipid/cholesterol/gamma-HCH transport system substrate-binding protein
MQRNIVETALGAIVLLVAAIFAFFFYRHSDISPQTGYELTASFSKVDGLTTGAPVRISGIKVGQVTGFSLDPERYTAIVRLNIDESVKLPSDTAAVIASAGLLDGKFMTLEPGADEEMLKPGGRIAFTQSTPSLEQLLGQVIFSLTSKDDKEKDDAEEAPAQKPAAVKKEAAPARAPEAAPVAPVAEDMPAHP